MIVTKFQSPAIVRSIFRRQTGANVPRSRLQKTQLSITGSQTQAKELSVTGRHLTIYQISSAHHVQGENPQHQSIVVRVSSIEIDLNLQRHIRVAGHDTRNSRIKNLIATSLATEEAVTAHLKEHIIVLLGRTVTAVRAVVTLHCRSPARSQAGMAEMSDLVVTIGHPTE